VVQFAKGDRVIHVGIVTGTYGDREAWAPLVRRAQRSCDRQSACNWSWRWVHRNSLQSARNEGAVAAAAEKSNWLVFLDADDELDIDYVAAMTRAAQAAGGACILRPATLGVANGIEDPAPVLIPRRDLRDGNFIVIAAMIPTEHFLAVGGFDGYPVLEDWALWLKLTDAGLNVVDVPEAVYRIHVRPDSRNFDRDLNARVYAQIRARHRA
jgi:GT2 family glycosyltransferase